MTIGLVTVGTVVVLLAAAFLTVPSLRDTISGSQTVADPVRVPRVAATAPPTATRPPAPSTSSPAPTTSAPPPLSDAQRQELAQAVNTAVNKTSPQADIGFTIYDRESGQTLTSLDPDEAMYTASVVKLLITIDSLHDSSGWISPDASASNRIVTMLEGSNDAIASSLWVKDGGPVIIKRMAGLIGLRHTTAATDPGQWGMAKASPNDIVTVYQYIAKEMPPELGKMIMGALAKAKNPADDGFPQYFGIPDALPGTAWAVKQGWMVLKSSLVLNTTGVVGADSRYVVVLMTQQRAGTSEAKGRTAVTAGISAVASTLKSAPTAG